MNINGNMDIVLNLKTQNIKGWDGGLPSVNTHTCVWGRYLNPKLFWRLWGAECSGQVSEPKMFGADFGVLNVRHGFRSPKIVGALLSAY